MPLPVVLSGWLSNRVPYYHVAQRGAREQPALGHGEREVRLFRWE